MVKIIGITENNCPKLYFILQKLVPQFGLKKVRVRLLKNGYNAGAWFFDYIFISKNLIDDMDEEELEAILGHELSHIYRRDLHLISLTRILFSIPFFLFIAFTILFRPSSASDFVFYFGFFIISIILYFYGYKIGNWIEIFREYMADTESVLKISNPNAMESALLKMNDNINNMIVVQIFLQIFLNYFLIYVRIFLVLLIPE